MKLLKGLTSVFSLQTVDEEKRERLQCHYTLVVLGVFAVLVGAVDLITRHGTSAGAALLLAAACFLNAYLVSLGRKGYLAMRWFLSVTILGVLTYFAVSGLSNGFSVIWALLVPALAMLVFGRARGTAVSGALFAVLVFLFWTPLGRALLLFRYAEEFLLRFPIVYIVTYVVSLLLEIIRRESFKKYRYLYTHDSLTGALNRNGLREYVADRYDRLDGETAFVMFDLDYFKAINDTCGHLVGDGVLKETAARIERTMGVPVCRWGGEEFAVIFLDGEYSDDKVEAALQLFREEPMEIEGQRIDITISAGAATFAAGLRPTENDMLRVADDCLYEAKESGRDRAVYRRVERLKDQ